MTETAPLPPGTRVTAYFYAARAGMVSVPLAPGDLEFLRELGLRAASLARWEGIPVQYVSEGPYRVHTWPAVLWGIVADAMANQAAGHGDYGPEDMRYGHSGDPAWESADGDPEGYGDPPSAANPRAPVPVPRGDPEHPHGYWEAGDYG